MEINKRKSIYDTLSKYDPLCNSDSDYIEITEWTNGEGWDITINDTKHFSLTDGELDAINYLIKHLQFEKD
jgi:hypothetical protein